MASSLVLSVVIMVIFIGGVDHWVRDHPVGAVSLVLLLGCYATSFVCLHKLQKGVVRRNIPIWSLSLTAAVAPLAALTYWSGGHVGVLVIGIAEVAAVLLHIGAIGILLVRKPVT